MTFALGKLQLQMGVYVSVDSITFLTLTGIAFVVSMGQQKLGNYNSTSHDESLFILDYLLYVWHMVVKMTTDL